MSYEAAYADLVTAAEAAKAAWTGDAFPMVYPNQRNLDIAVQQAPYVCLELYFVDAVQLSMGSTKAVADYGQIHVVAHTPENAGSLKAGQILSHFRPFFELQDLSSIRTKAAALNAPYQKAGWSCMPLVIPFIIHRLVTS